MGLYENVKEAAKKKGYSINRLEKELGFARSYISKFKTITPSADKIQRIADYLGVSTEYLLNGKENTHPGENSLSARDQKDIAKKLDGILNEIDSDDSLMFDSGEIDDETREYLKTSLSLALTNAKIMAKEKYTPKKYRKTEEK